MQSLKLLLSTPLMWILYLLAIAIWMLRGQIRRSRAQKGWYILLIGTFLLGFSSLPAATNLMLYTLEAGNALPATDQLQSLRGIIILGGGVKSLPGDSAAKPSVATFERVVKGVEVFKQNGAEFLILSGGRQNPEEVAEAEVMRQMALEHGVEPKSIILESTSRTTAEQATILSKMEAISSLHSMGLVTSSIHLPRALRMFQKQFPKTNFVPISATGPRSIQLNGEDFIPAAHALSETTGIVHELIGDIWYAVRY